MGQIHRQRRQSPPPCPDEPVTFEYPTEKRFLIRYLERLPLGTPYPAIVKHVAALTRHPDLSLNKILAVDCTGVGQPVVDLFRTEPLGCRVVPVTLTSGAAAARHGEAWHIPRDQLLSALELAIRGGQLLLSDALPEASALIEELRNLRRQLLPNGRDHTSPSANRSTATSSSPPPSPGGAPLSMPKGFELPCPPSVSIGVHPRLISLVGK